MPRLGTRRVPSMRDSMPGRRFEIHDKDHPRFFPGVFCCLPRPCSSVQHMHKLHHMHTARHIPAMHVMRHMTSIAAYADKDHLLRILFARMIST